MTENITFESCIIYYVFSLHFFIWSASEAFPDMLMQLLWTS